MVYYFYCCTCHHNQSVFFAARPIPQPMAQLKYGALMSASVEMMPPQSISYFVGKWQIDSETAWCVV